ncbi:MAG: sulfite exporter TauE/SafE family protein [Chitinispirillales bacterium]|jgi:sulfite exporter TauE/SafE/copper chaperone CopZ/plastocyanin domain-containing protein|nr:sulfite exporter TauE/SafE family protein [Chitinispirillales bacterium]
MKKAGSRMETGNLQAQTLYIGGMTCVNCQNAIERALGGMAGVHGVSVSYRKGTAEVTYDASAVAMSDLRAAVEGHGYRILEGGKEKASASKIAGAAAIILALYILLRMFSMSSLAASFPVAQTGMGYGMVLVIGLVTSVHCVAMCGGINLSQSMGGVKARASERVESPALSNDNAGEGIGKNISVDSPLKSTSKLSDNINPNPPSNLSLLIPGALYNAGRVISYTLVGAAVGALGSVIAVSSRFQGIALLLAGVFMLIMGVNMLGIFPSLRNFIPRMPKFFSKKIDERKAGRGPLAVGFLNGFMPCGPLQAMQLYALSTGSAVQGGISMFLFCIGTVPLMFAVGAVSGILSGVKGQAFSRRAMQAGAVLVAAMGLTMFANGWNLAGIASPIDRMAASMSADQGNEAFTPIIENGAQIVTSSLHPNRYPAITVQQGIPVRWTIDAAQGSINGCNNRIIMREHGVEHTFSPGINVIEFTPKNAGRFRYSCWMGMIFGTVTVVAEGRSAADAPREPDDAPLPAGVAIPTEKIALAQLSGNANAQTVTIRLSDDGFEPAIVVMQKGIQALWKINVESADPGNSQIIIPAYFSKVGMRLGENVLPLNPTVNFEFSTGDNIFYGYVKVVDDINSVDIEAVKAEAARAETLIYPDAYFDAGKGGGGGRQGYEEGV